MENVSSLQTTVAEHLIIWNPLSTKSALILIHWVFLRKFFVEFINKINICHLNLTSSNLKSIKPESKCQVDRNLRKSLSTNRIF